LGNPEIPANPNLEVLVGVIILPEKAVKKKPTYIV
jgi:hypothetical protein